MSPLFDDLDDLWAMADGEEDLLEAEPSSPRVLVAVMNNQRDFQIAQEQGWYRIPVKRAPPRLGADYLSLIHI